MDPAAACFASFGQGDYERCAAEADALLERGHLVHGVAQVLLISLLRHRRLADYPGLTDHLVGAFADRPFEQLLLRVTCGTADASEGLAAATDATQRCQAHYYGTASRLLSTRPESLLLAAKGFADAIATGARCLERQLAQADRARFAGIPADDPGLAVRELQAKVQALYAAGRFLEAVPVAERALARARGTLDPDDGDLAMSLNNLGELRSRQYRYEESQALFEEALEVWRRTLGGEARPGCARTLSNLAKAFEALGDYAAAAPPLREACDAFDRVRGGHADTGKGLLNLANLYLKMGSLDEAEQAAGGALASLRINVGEDDVATARARWCLAEIIAARGGHAEAEALYREALRTHRKLGGAGEDEALALGGLSNVLRAQGKQKEGLEVLRVALQRDPQSRALVAAHLAEALLDVGEAPQAVALLDDLVRAGRTTLGEDHPFLRHQTAALARARVAAGQTEAALAEFEAVNRLDDRLVAQVFSVSSEHQRASAMQSILPRLHLFLSFTLRHRPASGGAALDLVLRRKGLGAEALAAQRDAVMSGRYPALADRLAALAGLRMRIAQKTLAGAGPEGPVAHARMLASWEDERRRLEADLAQQVPEIGLSERMRSADHRAVAAALPESSALLEYARIDEYDFLAVPARGGRRWRPPRYVAFVLQAVAPDAVQLVDLGDAEAIDGMVQAFREDVIGAAQGEAARDIAIAARPGIAPVGDAGMALRAAIVDPLTPHLAGATRLFVSPDGDLTRLAFEALPLDGGERMIDRYALSYVGSGRDVLRFGERAAAAGEPVVIADPDFDLARAPGAAVAEVPETVPATRSSRSLRAGQVWFSPLPATGVEGQRVAVLLGVTPRRGGAALEAGVKRWRAPRVIHFATHGFFLADQPRDPGGARLIGGGLENPLLRSGLALAGANTWLAGGDLPAEAEDGILTAEDVSGLDLLGTELVVLSACETGMGEVHCGEGVFGLRRAFNLAGARTLVMSLWKVPDEQTRELMVSFYERLADGCPRAEALRLAQKQVRSRYPEPFFWGAFICEGEAGPLRIEAP